MAITIWRDIPLDSIQASYPRGPCELASQVSKTDVQATA